VLAFRGLERVALDIAEAGDIVAVAGFKTATVATRSATSPSNGRCRASRSIRRRSP